MSATAPDATLPQLEARLAHPPVAASFDQGELQGLPDPVCRYLRGRSPPARRWLGRPALGCAGPPS